MKKISELITKNFLWKLLSLLIAGLLWFVLVTDQNPIKTDSIRLPLEIRNESIIEQNDYILLNKSSLTSKLVTIKVRGTKADLDELKLEKNNFKAYIDLKPIDISKTNEIGKPMNVNVKYELPRYLDASNYQIISYSPDMVDITLDKYSTKEFNVSVNREGEVGDGYVSLSPIVTPNKVSISGANSIIDTIKTVEAKVNLSGVTQEISTYKALEVYDKDGSNITNSVKLSAREVQITIPVNKYAKIPISSPHVSGNVAQGHNIEEVEWTPKYVEVIGDEEDIKSIEKIEIPEIDVTGEEESKTEKIDLRKFFMDSSLTIKNGTPYEVEITVKIKKQINKIFNVPLQNFTVKKNNNPYKILSDTIDITLGGSEDDVNAVTIESITGVIDLSGLSIGSHNVPVSVNLPAKIKQIGKSPTVLVDVFSEDELPNEDGTINNNSSLPEEGVVAGVEDTSTASPTPTEETNQ